jgi:hypothetical protein
LKSPRRSIALALAVFAIGFTKAWAGPVTIPGAPQLPPHMHYEIRINSIQSRPPSPIGKPVSAASASHDPQWRKIVVRLPTGNMSAEDRLEVACDVAIYLSDDLKSQKQPTSAVLQDASDLKSIVCLRRPKK